MFENLLVRKTDRVSGHLDAGALAEALLFYQNVHLIIGAQTLGSLLNQISSSTFLQLLQEKRITATLQRDDFAVVTNTKNGIPVHDFGAIRLERLAGRRGRKRLNKEEFFEEQCTRIMKDKAPPKRVRRKIMEPYARSRPKRAW
jgi:hypothetical protein